MNENSFVIILLLAAHVGDGARQDGYIEKNLLFLASDAARGAVVLLDTQHVAVDHHAVFIVSQTLIGVEGGIEEERVVAMCITGSVGP